jgi:hypothetical protein
VGGIKTKQEIEDFKRRLNKRLYALIRLREKHAGNAYPPRYDDVYFEGLKQLDADSV